MTVRYHLSTIGWIAIMLFISLAPLGMGDGDSLFLYIQLDKLVHLVMYLVLTNLCIVGLKKEYSCRRIRVPAIGGAVVFSILFGISMELLQEVLTDYRQFEVADIVANIVGTAAGVGMFRAIYGKEFFS